MNIILKIKRSNDKSYDEFQIYEYFINQFLSRLILVYVYQNISPINLKITQPSTPGTISWSSYIKFADGTDSSVSTGGNEIDIFSLVTFDGSTFFANGLKNFS